MENFTKTEQAKLDMLTGGSKKANYIGGIIFAIVMSAFMILVDVIDRAVFVDGAPDSGTKGFHYEIIVVAIVFIVLAFFTEKVLVSKFHAKPFRLYVTCILGMLVIMLILVFIGMANDKKISGAEEVVENIYYTYSLAIFAEIFLLLLYRIVFHIIKSIYVRSYQRKEAKKIIRDANIAYRNSHPVKTKNRSATKKKRRK